MAKKTQTTTYNLDKTLTVDGHTYNINAVKSDKAISADRAEKAGELEHYLEIITYGDPKSTAYQAVYFTGKDNHDGVKIVPADGGTYIGTVNFDKHATTPDFTPEELAETQGKGIINIGQLETKIEQLTGIPVYSWALGYDKLQEVVLEDGSTVLQKLTIITGTEADYDKLDKNSCKDLPEAFLYLSTDGNKSVYLRLPDKDSICISKEIDRVPILSDGSNTVTAADITNMQVTNNIQNSRIENANNKIAENTVAIANIISGLSTVGEATSAESAAYATAAGSATKATKDGNNVEISKNYYRSASNTTKVNSITISTSGPSGGENGDIWIVYKA